MVADGVNGKEESLARRFAPDLTDVNEIYVETRKLLESYSGIPQQDLVEHVNAIRRKAFAVHPYPCIGQWRFLDLSLGESPQYAEILSRVKGGETLLDLGCCFGQDIRKLVADGAPSANCYGSDLRPEYFESGYDLFRDRDTLKSAFIAADVFASNSGLDALENKINIISASSFFHLFNWDDQKAVAKRCLQMLRREKGSMLVGRQAGNTVPGNYAGQIGTGMRYRHDKTTFEKMWEEIGQETGTKWHVDVEDANLPEWWPEERRLGAKDSNTILLKFAVRLE